MKKEALCFKNIALTLVLFLCVGSIHANPLHQISSDSSKPNTAKMDTFAQITKDTTVVGTKSKERNAVRIGYEVVDGDTIPVYLFNDVYMKSLKTPEEIKRYKKLVRDIKVALPYAKLAAFRLQMMEDNLSMIKSEKARKKYVKQCEKAIKEEFMNDLKNLTVTQGKLLLKLIHRETGKTTWDILSTYQGNLGPIFWNTMAAMYGATTKETFDPVVDKEIDEIIRKLELE